MTALLELRDLSVRFRTPEGIVRAVERVSWSVAPGETVAIVGESGCGKSVSARAIMGLVPQPPGEVEGRVLFEGRDLTTLDDAALTSIRGAAIGMVFQEPMTSLNPLLSIGKQLRETMEEHQGLTVKQAEARAVELLRMVEIPDAERRLRQYPHHFSGGMRQRVMIAIALSCEPKLVIADEPTTALDVTIQAQILELMKALSQRMDAALVVITHNLGIVARYATHVNVMYAGRIVESSATAELFARPRHPYTLGLLASVPRLDRPRGARLTPIDGQPPDLARLDAGCAYRPRCGYAVEHCAESVPPLDAVRPFDAVREEHSAACFETARL